MSADQADGRQILALPLRDNDAGAATVGDYLKALLANLWQWDEDFDSKRPFGNSGWTRDLYQPLIDADLVDAKVNEWGDFEEIDTERGDQLINAAIQALR